MATPPLAAPIKSRGIELSCSSCGEKTIFATPDATYAQVVTLLRAMLDPASPFLASPVTLRSSCCAASVSGRVLGYSYTCEIVNV